MWKTVWMASPALIFLLTLMPETSASNILLRHARRLRKLTGDLSLQSQSAQSEIEQCHMKYSVPSVLWFDFNLGQSGLTFLACSVGTFIVIASYFAYLSFYMVPNNLKKQLPRARTTIDACYRWLISITYWAIPLCLDLQYKHYPGSTAYWRGHFRH